MRIICSGSQVLFKYERSQAKKFFSSCDGNPVKQSGHFLLKKRGESVFFRQNEAISLQFDLYLSSCESFILLPDYGKCQHDG